jgi:chromosome segregation ATPase
MKIKLPKMKLAVFLALIWVFFGCADMLNFGKNPAESTNSPVADDPYAHEIVRLNQVVEQNSKSFKTKKAHLQLAQLYSNHNNPRRNYHKALEHLEAYCALEDFAADAETQNWLTALKEIDRLSKEVAQIQDQLEKSKKSRLALKRTNRNLTLEEIKLREKNRKLEESNHKLQKAIEMLKNLDQRLEEKRKNFNN